jgi:class 3 adenylate cyclase
VSVTSELRYAKTDGPHIAYQVVGDGPVDLLEINFGTTFSIASIDDQPQWSRFEARLASFTRLLRFDRRGIGLSDSIDPSVPPTLEDFVADAVAVLDAADSQGAVLFGSMMGGLVALGLAGAHPERATALVLVNSSARITRAPDYPLGIPLEALDAFQEDVQQPERGAQGVDDVALLAPSMVADEAFRRWWKRAGHQGAGPAVARAQSLLFRHVDVRPVLADLTVPTLILHRRENRLSPVGHGRYLAEHIDGAKYVELAGADHLPFVGDAGAVLDEIEEFVTGARGRHQPDRILSTILFTDIVASTELAASVGDDRWRNLLDAHDRETRRQIERFGGHVVKSTGDGVMATFDQPRSAVHAASAVSQALLVHGVELRAGIHTGEIELRDGDIGGIAVNIAARVNGLAQAGQVLVSRTVVDVVTGSDLEFDDHGLHVLKGVPGEWQVYALRRQE